MGTPHVCFADELQRNNNNNAKWLLELEPATNAAIGQGQRSPSGSFGHSPTPRYERNMGFFQLLSRRFGLRSSDDLVNDAAAGGGGQEEDAHSSSTDSYSSSVTASRSLAAARLELMSCASSETSSTIDIEEQQQQLEQQQQQQQQQSHNGKRKSLGRTSFSRLQRRSTSSLRRAFESLSLTSRSLSCSGPSPPQPPLAPPPASTALPLKSALKSASNVELHQRQPHRSASKSTSSSSACSSSSAASSTTAAAAAAASAAAAAAKSKVKPPPQRILRQPVSYTYLKGMSGLPTQRVPRSSVCCQYARR